MAHMLGAAMETRYPERVAGIMPELREAQDARRAAFERRFDTAKSP